MKEIALCIIAVMLIGISMEIYYFRMAYQAANNITCDTKGTKVVCEKHKLTITKEVV